MPATVVSERNRGYKNSPDTIRFDLKTRLCLMAATIYAGSETTVGEAVEVAAQLENLANAKCISMKRNNPV